MNFQRQDSGSNIIVPSNEEMEEHVDEIVRCMEEDETLMEDNPISEQLRMETLRDMPQCLTMKRTIKAKLTKSVSRKSRRRALGWFKRFKYRTSMAFTRFQATFRNLIYSFELWYSSLKAIEGHFGSGVATYFKFHRWIFLMNLIITIITTLFLIIPQIISQSQSNQHSTKINTTETGRIFDENNHTSIADHFRTIQEHPVKFSFLDIITGEGSLNHSLLFYGFYTNESISIIPGTVYDMQYAYFFTMLSLYVFTFIVLSISMAQSYRHNFIETSGGLRNVYAPKVFCGWDFSIATKEGAELKSIAIFNELKELLSDTERVPRKMTVLEKFWTRSIQIVINLFIILSLIAIALIMWLLLNKHRRELHSDGNSNASLVTAFIVTVIMTLGPIFFTSVIKYEDYKNPRTLVYISLIRTFCLEMVVIGVLVLFWLTDDKNKQYCWETFLGQEIYRLILVDFIISVLFVSFIDLFRHFIYKFVWKRIGIPEFDIARHTLQIIYNQTLFWVGFYYSPLLAVVVTLKFWFSWYVKRLTCLHCCKPSTRSWRAAQTQTIFLVMTFLALFAVLIVHVYMITHVTVGDCGPFRNYTLDEIFNVNGNQEHVLVKIITYLMKPGVVTGILIAIGVRVYYVRARSNAQKSMVKLLREMLVIEAKDKEFLLAHISKITNGTWMYNLNRTSYKRRNAQQMRRMNETNDDGIVRGLPRFDSIHNNQTHANVIIHNEDQNDQQSSTHHY